MDEAVHVTIAGRVQGVGFRHWTRAQAADLKLAGWVRNRLSGEVEAVFAGTREAVAEILRRCHDGPPSARVTTVVATPCESPGLTVFEGRPTA